jgi:hypothetical protein
MNESQLRKIIAQQLREEVNATSKSTLIEYYDQDDYGSRGSSNVLYKIFLSPMVDVLKATQLASQDILNSLKLIFKSLIILSPKKLVEARKDYEKTKESLDREWAPLIKKVESTVEGSGLDLVTFAVAPSVYMGYQFGKFAVNAPSTVADYFEKAGFDVPLGTWLKDIDDYDYGDGKDYDTGSDDRSSRRRSTSSRATSSASESPGILDRLRIFFLGETAAHSDDLILEVSKDEDNSKSSKLSKKNIESEIEKYFRETGFNKQLDKLAEDVIRAKQAHADKLLTASREQVSILKSFAKANNIEEFESAIKNAKSKGAEVEQIQKKIEALKADLQKKSAELKNDKSFKEKVQKSAKGKKISDDDIAKAADSAALEASKSAIAQLKQNVKESLDQSFDEIKKQIRAELSEDIPQKDSPLYSAFSNSNNGQRLLSIIDKAVNSIGPTSE